MPLATSLHLNDPAGPLVSFTQEDDVLVIFSDVQLENGDVLYASDGTAVFNIGGALAPTYASLWEARSIKQVLEEDSVTYDFGWKFIHLGYAVDFENGTSTYDLLVSLNQNRSGVGVQGPTSTEGIQGSPLTLLQKVDITNHFTQVNGWKSSSTTSSYALDFRDVQLEDSDYTYADAYVSWTNDSSDLSAPGIDGNGLVEYLATSTVEVEI